MFVGKWTIFFSLRFYSYAFVKYRFIKLQTTGFYNVILSTEIDLHYTISNIILTNAIIKPLNINK